MPRKLQLLLCNMCLILLLAGTSTAVTVPGYDGTRLGLSEIPDIIRHVAGDTAELSLRVPFSL